jgi:hypothetical protein
MFNKRNKNETIYTGISTDVLHRYYIDKQLFKCVYSNGNEPDVYKAELLLSRSGFSVSNSRSSDLFSVHRRYHNIENS